MSTGYFEFWARTRVHCAVGATVRLPALLVSLGAKRVLLLSDKGLEKIGLVERVAGVLREAAAGNQFMLAGVYTDVLPDAGSNSVNAATRYAREVGADAIVALGGGSAMDVAKGVKYALAHGLTDICDALAAGLRIDATGEPTGIAHISMPTTAGTGSEMTNGAVIFNDSTGVKALLVAPYLESDIALLDAQLTVGLPPSITADTGMDALTHAVETVVNPVQQCVHRRPGVQRHRPHPQRAAGRREGWTQPAGARRDAAGREHGHAGAQQRDRRRRRCTTARTRWARSTTSRTAGPTACCCRW